MDYGCKIAMDFLSLCFKETFKESLTRIFSRIFLWNIGIKPRDLSIFFGPSLMNSKCCSQMIKLKLKLELKLNTKTKI